jgi:NAD+ kinase
MTHDRTVLLVVHTGREEVTDTARRVEKTLAANGIGLRALSAEAVDRGSVHLSPDDMRALGVDIEVVDADPHAAEGCELVLVLGGDGTFLRAAELARSANIPVLGVNLGRIGFLAEAEAEAIDAVLERVVARNYRIEDRLTLDIVVRDGRGIVDRGWAMNEASLEKGPRLGVLGVVLEVDGRPVSTFGCDGVLVSTPTGSTAYAFSAGVRCCGPTLRQSWWCPTMLTLCSPGRWSPAPTPRSRSKSSPAATTRWCSATAAAKCWCRPAGGLR